jgi:hypothetical protein
VPNTGWTAEHGYRVVLRAGDFPDMVAGNAVYLGDIAQMYRARSVM